MFDSIKSQVEVIHISLNQLTILNTVHQLLQGQRACMQMTLDRKLAKESLLYHPEKMKEKQVQQSTRKLSKNIYNQIQWLPVIKYSFRMLQTDMLASAFKTIYSTLWKTIHRYSNCRIMNEVITSNALCYTLITVRNDQVKADLTKKTKQKQNTTHNNII